MAKRKMLLGVAHDIAHHSASGLSYLSPHMANALRGAKIGSTSVELLNEAPYPAEVSLSEPLQLALQALHSTALEIFEKYGFAQTDISSIRLFTTPAPWDDSGYMLHTRAVITDVDGKFYDSGWIQ